MLSKTRQEFAQTNARVTKLQQDLNRLNKELEALTKDFDEALQLINRFMDQTIKQIQQ